MALVRAESCHFVGNNVRIMSGAMPRQTVMMAVDLSLETPRY